MLDLLALSTDQERLYRHLLSSPDRTAVDLARDLRWEENVVRATTRQLIDRGFVMQSAGRGGTGFAAIPPVQALRTALALHQSALTDAATAVSDLADLYRPGPTYDGVVEAHHGRHRVAALIAELQNAAVREVCSLVVPPSIVVSREDNGTVEEAAVRRGVDYRVVLDTALLADPSMAQAIRAAAGEGEQIRICQDVPLKLLVIDGERALVPLSTGTDPDHVGALMVSGGGVLDALVALFELTWRRARPLPDSAAGGDLSSREQQIMELLIAGLTDRSIAAQVGVSERSVQRVIRQLMTRAGANSRVQLGWHAARNRWIA